MTTLDLKYNEHLTHLNYGLCSLLANASNADVTLAVDGKFFKAHQTILSIFSNYFEELFRCNPCQHPIFFLKDVSYQVMKSLLCFMYEGKVQILEEHFQDFLATGKALKIKGLANVSGYAEQRKQLSLKRSLDNPPTNENKFSSRNDHEAAHSAKKCKSSVEVEVSHTSICEVMLESPPVYPTHENNIGQQSYGVKAEPEEIPDQTIIENVLIDPNQCSSQVETLQSDDDDNSFDIKVEQDYENFNFQDEEDSLLVPQESLNDTQTGSNETELTSSSAENTLPAKSKARYENHYNCYSQWKATKQVTKTTENVLHAYVLERSKAICSASLWSEFSMLKCMLKIKENIDIGQFHKVQAFLKQNSKGYAPKQTKTLNDTECQQFLKEAPDSNYLMMKVALIMALHGACTRRELTNMALEDIKIMADCLLVTIPDRKNSPTTFIITDESIDGVNEIQLFNQYLALRPSHTPHNRLFIYYKGGKCAINPVGKNTFGQIPSKIAEYLKLDNPKLYTGHCFRRTSTSRLAILGK
ncbi:modifier of mdg4-like isoform X1 [Atheta coriaria]|uniref:modifier of mdg4-like isoform X1 n=1 Tax=Dalotia coriaria TaxID=877792 RepID=UPI0031F45745